MNALEIVILYFYTNITYLLCYIKQWRAQTFLRGGVAGKIMPLWGGGGGGRWEHTCWEFLSHAFNLLAFIDAHVNIGHNTLYRKGNQFSKEHLLGPESVEGKG